MDWIQWAFEKAIERDRRALGIPDEPQQQDEPTRTASDSDLRGFGFKVRKPGD